MAAIKFNPRLLHRLVIIFLIYTLMGQLTTGCFSFRMSEKQARKYYEDSELIPDFNTYRTDTWEIHYAEAGSDTLPLVVLVHGAPGSWSAFSHFFKDNELVSRTHLISVDRPGYGNSHFGRPETSLKNQAALLKPILEKNRSGKPAILVGHSLGGPIIARMAIDYPELVGCLIMVAPSIDPELEPDEWYRLPLYLPFVRWILPTSFDMTNREIYHLKDELEQMLPLWSQIKAPSTVIQGIEDKLVHPGNAEFANNMIANAPVEIMMLETNHFIPWNNAQAIKSSIYKHLDLLLSNDNNTRK